jgi:hypothetical protein
MLSFLKLETVTRRAPLGIRFVDIVREVGISDSLVVQAWQKGTSGPKLTALASPLSGVYGFRTLPGLGDFEVGRRPASDWCGPAPDTSPPSDIRASGAIYGWVTADEYEAKANFIVTVEDRLGRFLPQSLSMCLPKEKLIEVPLFSSPARPVLPGLGIIRGELATPAGIPAGWGLVTAILGDRNYVTEADARGMFVIFVPYARFPVLQNGGFPQGNVLIDQLAWDVTIQVAYEPSKQLFIAGVAAPDSLSILQQGSATVYGQVGTPLVELQTKIYFGQELVVRTGDLSQLLIDPALP